MRALVCGDVHCKPDILFSAVGLTALYDIDYFVFLGDACDNFGATQEDNLTIIKTLIDLKKAYGENFIWLLGNHDWGYYDTTISMTGHIKAGEANTHYLLAENIDLWDLFFAKENYLFSHAGISADFLSEVKSIPYRELKSSPGVNNPLNNVGYSCGGWSKNPSLLWARPNEVRPLPLDNIQVVGHTPVEKISVWSNGLVVCDTHSQYPDGSFVGDNSLLLIDGDRLTAVHYKTGKEMYDIDINTRAVEKGA